MKALLRFVLALFFCTPSNAQVPYSFTSYDVHPGNSSSLPARFTPFGNRMVFSAITLSNGREPWISDGTITGTYMLRDIYPGDHHGNPTGFAVLNGKLYFAATDSVSEGLWVSDGTSAGTQLIKRIIPSGFIYTDETQIAVVNNKLLFRGQDAAGDVELWISNGTDTGTHLLKNINPYGNSYPLNFFVFRGNAYFTVDDGVYGNRTWMSDGTPQGTHILLPGNPTATPLLAKNSTPVVCNGNMYFVATDDMHGTELWITDGSEAGTHIIKDCAACDGADTRPMAVINSKVYFIGNTKTSSDNLWVTDGTANGTLMVYAPNPSGNSDIGELAVVNSKLYFNAREQTHGYELWTSDGTASGTHIFKDLNPGEQSSYPAQLHTFGNKLLFSARPSGQTSFFYTDGNVIGELKPVKAPRVVSHDLIGGACNGIFYFGADYGNGAGYDLWSIKTML